MRTGAAAVAAHLRRRAVAVVELPLEVVLRVRHEDDQAVSPDTVLTVAEGAGHFGAVSCNKAVV